MREPDPRENPYSSPLDWWRKQATSSDYAAPIVIEGENNLKEYVRGTLVEGRRILRWIDLTCLILALLILTGEIVVWRLSGDAIGWDGVALSLFALLGPLWIRIWLRVICRSFWRRATLAREPFRGVISSDAITMSTPTHHMSLKWEAMRGFREGRDLVLIGLAHNAGRWLHFSRRHFAPQDWERFLNLVKQKLPQI